MHFLLFSLAVVQILISGSQGKPQVAQNEVSVHESCRDISPSCIVWGYQCGSSTDARYRDEWCLKTCGTCMPDLPSRSSSNGKLEYKWHNTYSSVWNDKGSRGDFDGSFFNVDKLPHGYCALGGIARGDYKNPSFSTVIVPSTSPFVEHPTGFSKVWYDKFSRADLDGSVWNMNAPNGYKCIGAVGMTGHDNPPRRSDYCCVKPEFLVKADVEWTYSDTGTGAWHDLSVWTVRSGSSDGIESYPFVAVAGYSNPRTGYLLKKSKASLILEELQVISQITQVLGHRRI